MGLLISLGIAAVIAMLLLLQVWLGSWRFAALCLVAPLERRRAGCWRRASAAARCRSDRGSACSRPSASQCAAACCSSAPAAGWSDEVGESPSYSLLLQGSAERLVPVATTAAVTGLIALTFVVFGARPGQELAYPFSHRHPRRRARRHGHDAVRRPGPVLAPRRRPRLPPRADARRGRRARTARNDARGDPVKGTVVRRANGAIALGLVVLGVAVSACGGSSESPAPADPARVTKIAGGRTQITLTADAAKRIDLKTAKVANDGADTVIPYSAVLYDPDGATWTYTSPKPLEYRARRHHRQEHRRSARDSHQGPGSRNGCRDPRRHRVVGRRVRRHQRRLKEDRLMPDLTRQGGSER